MSVYELLILKDVMGLVVFLLFLAYMGYLIEKGLK